MSVSSTRLSPDDKGTCCSYTDHSQAAVPQPTASAEHPAYHYKVKMTCGGCSGAIERVLKKNVEARESAFHREIVRSQHPSAFGKAGAIQEKQQDEELLLRGSHPRRAG